MFAEMRKLIDVIEYEGCEWLKSFVKEDLIDNEDNEKSAYFSVDKIIFEPDWSEDFMDVYLVIDIRAKLPHIKQVEEQVFIYNMQNLTFLQIAWYVIGYISARLDIQVGV